MGRSKSYNELEALDTLAKLFAESGYEATSIDQIATATGMKRGSIYHAYGSKANLFRLAFEHYLEGKKSKALLADLLIVALWERAGSDPEVRETSRQAITWLEQESGVPIASILEQRLTTRAEL